MDIRLIGIKSLSNCISNNILKRLNSAIKNEAIKFPSMSSFYSDRDATLGRFFTSTDEMEFECFNEEGERVQVCIPFVYCNDIVGLINLWAAGSFDESLIMKLSDHAVIDFNYSRFLTAFSS